MSASKSVFGWITPEMAIHMLVLLATGSGAFCMLKTRADISDIEIAGVKVHLSAVEAQANQTSILVAQNKVRLDNQERVLDELRGTTESIRTVLNDVSGDLKGVKALLQPERRD